jgi:Flp pilus assembly pilin Flp
MLPGDRLMKTRVKQAIYRFHKNEDGIEAIQVVMILAIAAVALIVVRTQWSSIKGWFNEQVSDSVDGW